MNEHEHTPENEKLASVISALSALNNLIATLKYGEYCMMKSLRDLVKHKMMEPTDLIEFEQFNRDIKKSMETHGLTMEVAEYIHGLNLGLNSDQYPEEQITKIEEVVRKMQDIYFDLSVKGYTDDQLGIGGEIIKL